MPPKINSKSVPISRLSKTVLPPSTFATLFTTNCTTKTTHLHPLFPKPPQKKPIKRKKAPAFGRGSSRKKNRNLDAERRPAPAGALHRGILKLEARSLQGLHIVHRAVAQVHRRGSVHKHL